MKTPLSLKHLARVLLSLGRILGLSLAALLAAETRLSAQSLYDFNKTATGTYDWGTNANWLPNSSFPNGAGVIANLNSNIAGNITVNLASGKMIGILSIGDLSGSNAGFNVTGSALTFDGGDFGPAFINNTISSATNSISAPIVINGILNVNLGTLAANDVTIAGSVTGGALNVLGAGLLNLTGSYAGPIKVASRGLTDSTNANLLLANVTGNSVNGLTIGNASRGGTGSSVVHLGANEQIDDASVIRFDGGLGGFSSSNNGNNGYFKLLGFTETVAGISDYTASGVIENMEATVVNTNGNLILNTSGSQSYNGFIRNRQSGTGTGLLNITINGTGVQTLAGGNITYTGATAINGGRLVLQSTTAFASNITNNAELELQANSTWTFGNSITGSGNVTKTGASNLTITGNITLADPLSLKGKLLVQPTGGTLTLQPAADKTNTYDGFIFNSATNASTVTFTAASTTDSNGWTSHSVGGDFSVTGPLATVNILTNTPIAGGLFITNAALSISTPSTGVTGTGGKIGDLSYGVTLNGNPATTSLTIKNTTAANDPDRVGNDIPWTINGGKVVFSNAASAGTSYAESLGAFVLNQGDLEISTTQAVSGQTSTLSLASLTRGSGTTVKFLGTTSLGVDARNRVKINGQADGLIGPWATIGNEWATYASVSGVQALNIYNAGTSDVTWTAGDDVKVGNSFGLTLSRIVNSVNMQATAANNALILGLGANNLSITSGGILSNGGDNSITSTTGSLTVGLGVNELITTVESGRTLTISAPITDAGSGSSGIVSLTKSGAGTLLLSGDNTFTGNVYINQGIVQITTDSGAKGSLGAAPTGSPIPDQVQINGGELQATDNISWNTNRGVTIGTAGGTLSVASGDVLSFNSAIVANGVFTYNTAPGGTLSMGGPIGSNFSAGFVTVGNNSDATINFTATGDTFGTILINGGTVNLGASLTSNTINGNLTVNSGTLVLNGANVFMGTAVAVGTATTVGALRLASATALDYSLVGPPTLTVNALGQFHLNNNGFTVSQLSGAGIVDNGGTSSPVTFTVDQASNTVFSGTLRDYVAPPSTPPWLNFTKTGIGNLILSGGSTYSGVTTISGGTLTITQLADGGFASGIGASSNAASNLIIQNGAALVFNGTPEAFTNRSFTLGAGQDAGSIIADGVAANGRMRFGNGGTVAFSGSGARTLTLGGFSAGDNEFNLVLGDNSGSDPTSLNKTGNGTWVLTQANTYTGNTTVSGGILAVSGAGTLGAGSRGTILLGGPAIDRYPVGGVLDLRNANIANEPLFMEGGVLGVSTGSSTWGGDVHVSVNSSLRMNIGTTLNLTGAVTGNGDLTVLGRGTVNFTGATPVNNTGGLLFNGGNVNFNRSAAIAADAFGVLTLSSGDTVLGTSQGSTSHSVTFKSLTRAGSIGATVNFTGTGLGTNSTNRVVFTTAPTLTNNLIGGWATVGNEFATYVADADTGTAGNQPSVAVLAAANYALSSANAQTTWTAGTLNVKLDNDQTLTGTPRSIYSLNIQSGTARTLSLGANQLIIQSGGLLANGADHLITGTAGGSLTGGLTAAATYDLFTTVDASRTLTINVPIVDRVSGTSKINLVKSGAGALVLGGSNTYTGKTFLNQGLTRISSDANLGTAPAALVADQLTFNGGELQATADITLATNRGVTVLAGGGTISVSATKTLTIASKVQANGTTAQGSGTFTFNTAPGGTLTLSGASNDFSAGLATTGANNNAVLNFAGTGNTIGTLSMDGGTINLGNSGTANTIKKDITITSGNLVLDGTNTFTGALITINGGSITLKSATALKASVAPVITLSASGAFHLNGIDTTIGQIAGGGIIDNNSSANAAILTDNQSNNTTFTGVLQDGSTKSLSFVKSGTGNLTLAGANIYTGATTLSGGTVSITGSLGNTAVGLTAGILSLDAASAISQNVVTVSGTGTLVETVANGLSGGAALTINSTTAAATLTKANNFNGATTLTAGTLTLIDTGALGTTSALVLNGGTLKLRNDTNATFTNAGTLVGGNTIINVDQATVAGLNKVLSLGTTSIGSYVLGVTGGNGYNLALGAVTLTGNATLNPTTANVGITSITGAFNVTLSGTSTSNTVGAITTGARGVTRSGGGTWAFTGTNTYTGSTLINGGTTNATGTFGNTAITIKGGTLSLQNAGAVSQNQITLIGTGSLQETVNNALSGTAALALNSSTSLATLGSSNNFTGATTLNQGTLVLSNTSAIASSNLALNGGILQLRSNTAATFLDATTTIGGNAIVDVNQLASGTNNQLSLGPVSLGTAILGATGGNGYTLGLGALTLTGAGTLNPTSASMTVASVTGAFDLTLKGTSTGNGITGVISNSTGDVTLSGSGNWTVGGANTYSGVTTITGGTLIVPVLANGGSASSIGQSTNAASNLIINGGALSFTGTSSVFTDRSFTLGVGDNAAAILANGTPAGSILHFGNASTSAPIAFTGIGPRTLTLGGGNTSDNEFNLVLADASDSEATALTKTGLGTWVMTRSNTYTGRTIVSGGTLAITSDRAPSSSVGTVLNSGGTLDLRGVNYATGEVLSMAGGTLTVSTGSSRWGGAIEVNAASSIVLNSSTKLKVAGAVVGASNLTQTGTGTLIFNSDVNLTGNVTLASALNLAPTAGASAFLSGVNTFGGFNLLSPYAASAVTLTAKSGANTASTNQAINGAFTVTGPYATVDIQANTPITGALSITRANLILEPNSTTGVLGTGGKIGTPASITMTGNPGTASFTISNGVTANDGNRVGSSAWTSNGGKIVFSNTSGSASYAETLGTLTLSSGDLEVNTAQVNAGQASTLTFGSLTRSTVGAAVNFTGISVGTSTRNTVLFTSAPSNVNGIIGGWATASNEFATYGANGVTALATYRTTIDAAATPWLGTDNVKITSGTSTLSNNATRTANTINLQGSGISLALNNKILVIGTGGLLSNGGDNAISGTGTLTAGGTLFELIPTVEAGRILSISSVIGNNGTNAVSLTKSGAGTLILTGNNTYTGKTYLNQGVLQINGPTKIGAAPAAFVADQLTMSGGELRTSASTTWSPTRGITIGGAGGVFSVSTGATLTIGPATGGGNAIQGNGILTFDTTPGGAAKSGTLTITANVNLTGGLATIGNNAAALLNLTGAAATIGAINLNGGNVTIGSASSVNTLSGDITVNRGTLKIGVTGSTTSIGGNTILNGGGITLNGTNTFTGSTFTVNGGILTMAATTSLGSTGLIVNGGGEVDLSNFDLNVSQLSGTGLIANGGSTTNSTLIVNQAGTTTFAGTIRDTTVAGNKILSFTKTGIGSIVLTGANTYSGVTSILGGTLSVQQLANGTVASGIGLSSNAAANLVLNGGILRYDGNSNVSTDRSFTLGVGANAGAIIADGVITAATMTMSNGTNHVAFTGSGNRTLTLGGVNQGTNVFGLFLDDNGSDVTSLNKIGDGTWLLNRANTYSGLTTVSGGILIVTANGALGSGAGGTVLQGGPAVGGYPVGGVLDVQTNYATAESLNLTGGMLVTSAGTGTWAGTVNVASDSYMQVNSGATLNISGGVTGSGSLNVQANGTLNINGNVGLVGTASITKTGAGNVTFGGNTNVAGGLNLMVSGGNTTLSGVGTFGGINFYSPTVASTLALTAKSGVNTDTTVSDSINGNFAITGPLAKTDIRSNVLITGGLSLTNASVTVQPTNVNGVTGNGGQISGASNITLVGTPSSSNFTIANSSVQNSGNRIADSIPWISNGGSINVTNNDSTASYSETLGSLTLAGGDLEVNTQRGFQSVGTTSTLAFSQIASRAVGSAVNFSGAILGLDTQNRVLLTSAPALDGSGLMGGWAVVGNEFASYDASLGVKPIVATLTGFVSSGAFIQGLATTANLTVGMSVFGQGIPIGTTIDGITDSATVHLSNQATLSTSTSVTLQFSNDAISRQNSGSETTWLPFENVKINSGNVTLTGDRTINSLNLQGSYAAASNTLAIGTNGLVVTSGGILSSGGSNTISGSSAGFVTAGPAIGGGFELIPTVENGRTLTIGARITDNGSDGVSLTKAGNGVLVLSGANTYTGRTFINEGTVKVSTDFGVASGSLGAAPSAFFQDQVQINGGELLATASFSWDLNRGITIGAQGGTLGVAAGKTLKIGNKIQGNGVLTFDTTQTGTLVLDGNNDLGLGLVTTGNNAAAALTLTGSNSIGYINMIGGKVTIGSGASANTINGAITVTGGTLNLGQAGDVNTVNGDITLNTGTVNLSGTNYFNGANITVSGGTLKLLSSSGLSTTTPPAIVINSGGQVQLLNSSLTVSQLTGAGSIGNNGSTADATLTVNQANSTSFTGAIRDASGFVSGAKTLGLTKAGAGNLTLTGQNTYTGITSIAGGSLTVSSLASGFNSSNIGASSKNASNLVFANGGQLIYLGSDLAYTDRSFTLGDGLNTGSIIANGTARSAVVNFGTTSSDPVAFTGSAARTLTLGGTNLGENSFNLVLGDSSITQSTSLNKTGVGTWLLTRQNSYSGFTTVSGGVLAITSNGALGAAGSQGTVLLAAAAPSGFQAGSVLDLRDVQYTNIEPLFLQGGMLAASQGTNSWAGPITFFVNSNVQVNGGSQLTLSGSLSGAGAITQLGQGTLILSGDNARTLSSAAYTLSAGVLVLDYTSSASTKLSGAAKLTLGGSRFGGTVILRGGTTGISETVLSLALNAGDNRIQREAGSDSVMSINSITRAAGATIDFSSDNIATTDTLNGVTGGIIGGWATVGGSGWAINSGSNTVGGATVIGTGVADGYIRALPTANYTNDAWASGNNTTVTLANSTQGGLTNTLRFDAPAQDVVNLSSGTNVIATGGLLITPNVGNNTVTIAGPGSLAGVAGDGLIVLQNNLSGTLVISAPIADNGVASGLDKLGAGTLILGGLNTYTGVTTVNDGTLSVTTVGDGGVPSTLGASTSSPANLVLNGGILEYTGSDASTNRGFTVNYQGRIDVPDENTVLTMSGSIATPSAAADITDYTITKLGAGTLRLTGATVTGSGITGWDAEDGRVQLVMATGNDRYAVPTLATLTLGGGAFELVGDKTASRSQTLAGQFTVKEGESEIKSTSQLDVTTTLVIQDAVDQQTIARNNGGTVKFIENPNLGTTSIVLNTGIALTGIPIPWAVYKNTNINNDTTLGGQPGFNDFALILPGGSNGVTNASAQSIYDVSAAGSNAGNANTWQNTTGYLSEGASSFTGTTSPDLHVQLLRYTNQGASTVTISNTLTLDSGAIFMAEKTGNNQKTITGGKLTAGNSYSSSAGLPTNDLILQNYNYSKAFTINSEITDFSTVRTNVHATAGSKILSFLDANGFPYIYGLDVGMTVSVPSAGITNALVTAVDLRAGTATLNTAASSGNGTTDLTGTFGKAVNLVQAGQSVTTEVSDSIRTQVKNLSTSTSSGFNLKVDSTSGLTAGMTVSGVNIASGSHITSVNVADSTITLDKIVSGNGVTTITATPVTGSPVVVGATTTPAYILTVGVGNLTGLKLGMSISGPGVPINSVITAIDSLSGTITINQAATSSGAVAISYYEITTNSSTLAGVGTTLLTGTNTYTGTTFVQGGVLRLGSTGAIPGGIAATGGTSHIKIEGGIIGLGFNDFTRGLGTGVNQVEFTSSGGFAAYGANRSVNLGGSVTPTKVTWDSGGFVPGDDTFVLGAPDADSTLDFRNPIDLGGKNRLVRADNGTAAVDGLVSGALTGSGGLIKSGFGTLSLSGANTYQGGTFVAAGTLAAPTPATAFGSGPIRLGATTDTNIDDSINLSLGAGTLSNAITVGNQNRESVISVTSSGNLNISGALALGKRTFISSAATTNLTLSGQVSGTGGITLIGGGSLTLSQANSYGTDNGSGTAVDGGTTVRAGTVRVLDSGGLGSTTVELGDTTRVTTSVDRATNSTSMTMLGGVFVASHSGTSANADGPGAFVNVSTTVDGHTYTSADADTTPGDGLGKRILIKDDTGNPERNGIYRIVSVTANSNAGGTETMLLVRDTDFSNTTNMTYGTQVYVQSGSSAGVTYFMVAPGVTVRNAPDTDPTVWIADNVNPDVALLAAASGLGVTSIANNIDINATNGTGTTTIGAENSVTSGELAFAGNIKLQNISPGTVETKQLLLNSATSTGNGVTFSGTLTEANGTEDVLSINKTGVGVVTLTNSANTYHGTTTVTAGVLRAGVDNAFPVTTAVILANAAGAVFDVNSKQVTIGSLTGGGSLGGNVTLGTGGKLTVGDSSSTTFSGMISGTGSQLVKQGTGTLTLAGASTFTGTTTVNAGELDLNSPGGGALSSNLVVSGGAAKLLQSNQIADTAMVSVSSGTFDIGSNSDTVAGVKLTGGAITGTTGTLTSTTAYDLQAGSVSAKLGGNVGVVKAGTGTVSLNAVNSYTGITEVDAGILQVGVNNAIPTGGAVLIANVAGAVLDINSKQVTIGSLSGGGTSGGNVTLGTGGKLTVGDSFTSTYGGIISSSGASDVVKQGSGTLVLTGVNTFSGTLAVNAGTLQVGSNSSPNATTGTASVTVSSGAAITGTGQVGGGGSSITSIAAGGKLAFGDSAAGFGFASNSTMSIAGALSTISGGTIDGQLQFKITAPTLTDSSFASAYASSGGTLTAASYLSSNPGLVSTWNAPEILPAGSRNYDFLSVTGDLKLSSGTIGSPTIKVLSNNFTTQASGQVFNLLDWSTLGVNGKDSSLAFTGVFNPSSLSDLVLPTLNAGLNWDTSLFNSKGILVVVGSVPEPKRLLLVVLGLTTIMSRRRRRSGI